MQFGVTELTILGGLYAIIVMGGKWLKAHKTVINQTKKDAIDAVPALHKLGLEEIGDLIRDFASGDPKEVGAKVVERIRDISRNGDLVPRLKNHFFVMLANLLEDPAERQKIVDVVRPHLDSTVAKK